MTVLVMKKPLPSKIQSQMSREGEGWGTHSEDEDTEGFVATLDEFFDIPGGIPFVHHIEDVASLSGSEGCSSGCCALVCRETSFFSAMMIRCGRSVERTADEEIVVQRKGNESGEVPEIHQDRSPSFQNSHQGP